MSILIGFTGRAGCGKDTAADYLRTRYSFHTMSFAGPLKKVASVLFAIPETYFHNRELKEKPMEEWDGLSPRHMLQLLGTEAIRTTFGNDFWIKRWLNDYRAGRYIDHVVVTDVRFNNEAQVIRDLGGTIVHIQRREPNDLDHSAATHASESGVPFDGRFDQMLINNGTLEDLRINIDRMMGQGDYQ